MRAYATMNNEYSKYCNITYLKEAYVLKRHDVLINIYITSCIFIFLYIIYIAYIYIFFFF